MCKRGLSPLLQNQFASIFQTRWFRNPDFSVLVYTSLVNFMGLYSLPTQYYIFLFAVAASCLGLMTVEKKSTQRKKDFVLKRGKATVMKKKLNTPQSQGNLLASL